MTAPPLTIRLFGPFAAEVRGEPMPPVRTRSVEWVLALLALIQAQMAQSRLVTLVGAGGIGKTRLAMEVAGTVADRIEGGAAWVDLAPVTDEALVVPAIAAAIGLGEAPAGGDALSALMEALLVRGPLLLALDNCEHVVDAVAGAVETLLRACPDVSVLATSRERLALQGEIVWRVPSLASRVDSAVSELPGSRGEAQELSLRSAAADLFLERAQAARAGLTVADHEDAEAICAICERLDGIPLAIELAAARISALTPRQIAERLGDRFAILTTGSRTAPPRHKTLHALIDWSYALLTPDERALFRRLSVFIDGWTLEAAEEALGSNTQHPTPSIFSPRWSTSPWRWWGRAPQVFGIGCWRRFGSMARKSCERPARRRPHATRTWPAMWRWPKRLLRPCATRTLQTRSAMWRRKWATSMPRWRGRRHRRRRPETM